MGEIYRIIPVNDRPYEWALKQLKRYFPRPTAFKLNNLDKFDGDPDATISIFHKENHGKNEPDIIRVVWNANGGFKYSVLVNYDEIKAKYPGIVKLYEQNGLQAYNAALRHHEQNEKAGYTCLNDDLEKYVRQERATG